MLRFIVHERAIFHPTTTPFLPKKKHNYTQTWPQCWVEYTACNKSWVDSVDYLQISGILVGQLVLGFCADALGRRTVQIFDAFVMTIGVILLTSVSSPSLNGFVIALAWSFFVYGVGVGGEYVGACSSSAFAVCFCTHKATDTHERIVFCQS